MLRSDQDTIAAIGTKPGEAAIGIVKISGAQTIAIADKIFRSASGKRVKDMESFSIAYGHVVDQDDRALDEVILSVMRTPRSYTREDVVEINTHGGIIPTSKVLELCLSQGARIAEPGEFTKRAFINGRIDLSQAEAVIEMIRSKTEESLRIAAKNIDGESGTAIKEIRQRIIEVLAQLEASVDFIEEDLELTPYSELSMEVANIRKQIDKLIVDEEKGEIIKNGVKVAIVGKPNVGKSSLLNLLIRKEKAIVTPIPGTTRDAVEEIIYISGIPLILVDTAGIRKTSNKIEKIGVERSLKHINEAELVMVVVDGSKKLDQRDREIIEKVKDKEIIGVINKIDLGKNITEKDLKSNCLDQNIVEVSATENLGIDSLEEKIKEMIMGKAEFSLEEMIVVNSRHKSLLKEVGELLKNSEEAMKKQLSEEFPAADLRVANDLLGEITGETASDEVLDRIFSQFCIGK
ncbi:MAG: tRNA uridine-5-carboxymethylaminomethyl(34) synthesis GTPase MnmE [Actinomycetia bacterium]|nr:tRNA uridine-5-carboxymethylaminomethyl(34) synthesis GTPase MnmE [Actinomycetes bacterium]